MSYTVHQAKTNLSRLIKEAEKGKDVVITRGKKPVAKLVAISNGPKTKIPGRLKGLISWEADAFAPLQMLNCGSGACDCPSRHARVVVVVEDAGAALGGSAENN